ncbi:MAG: tetratricopeptide repeat protein [Isosphaeraceae bacterium]
MSSTITISGNRPSQPSGAGGPRRLAVVSIAALLVGLLAWASWLLWSRRDIRDLRENVRRGRLYLRQGRPDLAFQAVCDARDDELGADQAVTLAATALIRMGKLRMARLALERSIRLNPRQFEAMVTLAELHADLGNGARSAWFFEAAARLRPRESRVWLALARVLKDLSELPRAARVFQTVLELDPDQKEALIGVIRCWVLRTEPDRADPWVKTALERFPDDPSILGLAARQACMQNRAEAAIGLADRALRQDQRNTDALRARARALMSLGRWKDALADAERGTAVKPNDLESLQLLSMIETRLGLEERAAETLRKRNQARERERIIARLTKEMEQEPEDPALRWRLGQVALEGGLTFLASRCFEAALALDASYQPARDSLVALRESQKRMVPGK